LFELKGSSFALGMENSSLLSVSSSGELAEKELLGQTGPDALGGADRKLAEP
jgi:hypothetical protein